jgi:hypothetical protein
MMSIRIRNETASVLVLCLLVFTLLVILSFWALTIASLNRKSSVNHSRQIQAHYLAEGAIDLALSAIRENPLWRGIDPKRFPSAFGEIDLNGIVGNYAVTVSDGVDDGKGRWDPHLPGGVLSLFAEGSCAEAYQSLSCWISFTPSIEKTCESPKIAVITSGDIFIAGGVAQPTALDSLGQEDAAMIQTNKALPPFNQTAFMVMADKVIGLLDDEEFDQLLSDRKSFWNESTPAARPFITYVSGDMVLSEKKTLYGIFFVEGEKIVLSDKVRVIGIVYAPNAKSLTLPECADPFLPPIKGQVIAGPGEIHCSGFRMGVQLVDEYVESFSDIGGASLTTSIVPGSWHRPL